MVLSLLWSAACLVAAWFLVRGRRAHRQHSRYQAESSELAL